MNKEIFDAENARLHSELATALLLKDKVKEKIIRAKIDVLKRLYFSKK